jgi:hypothetical protein
VIEFAGNQSPALSLHGSTSFALDVHCPQVGVAGLRVGGSVGDMNDLEKDDLEKFVWLVVQGMKPEDVKDSWAFANFEEAKKLGAFFDAWTNVVRGSLK